MDQGVTREVHGEGRMEWMAERMSLLLGQFFSKSETVKYGMAVSQPLYANARLSTTWARRGQRKL